MNWFDRVISFVSPQAGLKRVRARALTEAILAYDGVRSARRQGGWGPTGTSGNAEIGPNNATLRANARDLCRNTAYGRKAKREWAKRVVGTGITPRPVTGNEKLDKIIAEHWKQWTRQCCSDHRVNFYAAEKLIVSSFYESGEVLVRLWDRRPEDGLAVPLQIQILEADYIDSDRTQTIGTGYIIQGVEFDPIGRIRGYWLYSSHPGEVITTSLRVAFTSKFVPVEYVLHHAEVDRPGDVRAVTRLAVAIGKLKDIAEYGDAKIMRAKIEACLAAFVTQSDAVDGPTLGAVTTDTENKRIEEFRPAMVTYLRQGEDVKFAEPTGSGDYAAYKKTELREVAAGLEIPYVVLDDNLEAVNYSSYRGGLLGFRDAIEEYRWNWLIPQVLDPIYRRFIEKLYMMRAIPEPVMTVEWDPPPFDLLDREAEAKADRQELQIGKKTWPQLVGEQGNDPETQLKEIAEWAPKLREAGVTFANSKIDDTREIQGEEANANPNEPQ